MIRDTCQSPWQQPLSSNIITYNHQKVFVNELIVNSFFIDLVFMLPLLCCCMITIDLLLTWNSVYYPFIPIVTVSVLLLLFTTCYWTLIKDISPDVTAGWYLALNLRTAEKCDGEKEEEDAATVLTFLLSQSSVNRARQCEWFDSHLCSYTWVQVVTSYLPLFNLTCREETVPR